jgi:hypothetical protein
MRDRKLTLAWWTGQLLALPLFVAAAVAAGWLLVLALAAALWLAVEYPLLVFCPLLIFFAWYRLRLWK